MDFGGSMTSDIVVYNTLENIPVDSSLKGFFKERIRSE